VEKLRRPPGGSETRPPGGLQRTWSGLKRDRDGDRTVIEKREELNVLPVPNTEEKTIIKKERD
jgi:hypothetical protein